MEVEVIKPSIQSTVYEDPPINKMSCGRQHPRIHIHVTSQSCHGERQKLSWEISLCLWFANTEVWIVSDVAGLTLMSFISTLAN